MSKETLDLMLSLNRQELEIQIAQQRLSHCPQPVSKG